MARVRVISVPPTFPFGREKIDKIGPSTGPYGKHVGNTGQPWNAVKVRSGGKVRTRRGR